MTRNYAVAYRPEAKFSPAQEHLIDTMTNLIVQRKKQIT